MRRLIGTGLVFVLVCGTTAAQEPIDKKQLVGGWEEPGDKAKKREKVVAEFDAKGKAKLKYGEEAGIIIDYDYTVEGRRLTLTAQTKDGIVVRKFTVAKLTDDELTIQEDTGTKHNFKRIKEVKE
ncbi:MAG: hypothetical protein C0467_03235 [Planctomycetaceae bacterium]|nr:hypothetical protein [Planctomycetaceae bacterium]